MFEDKDRRRQIRGKELAENEKRKSKSTMRETDDIDIDR